MSDSSFYSLGDMKPLMALKMWGPVSVSIGPGRRDLTWDEVGKLVMEFNQAFVFYRLFVNTPIDNSQSNQLVFYVIVGETSVSQTHPTKIPRQDESDMNQWLKGFIKAVQATRRKIRVR